MFGRSRQSQDLDRPPLAASAGAVEILRVWIAPNSPQQLTLKTAWDDPAAWGLLLVDIARHAALAYQRDRGADPEQTLQRIHELFDAEWSSSTDEPRDITDQSN
jgi:hypothetical protein